MNAALQKGPVNLNFITEIFYMWRSRAVIRSDTDTYAW